MLNSGLILASPEDTIQHSRPDPFGEVFGVGGGKEAPVARGEGAEVEGADADADELEDVVAETGAHAADLALAAFGEDDLEPGALGGGAAPGGVEGWAGRERQTAVDLDPAGGDPAFGLAARADPELGEGPAERPATGRRQRASGRLARANVIRPSHTTFPSTRAWPWRVPILLRRRTTSPSRRTWSPAVTGRR